MKITAFYSQNYYCFTEYHILSETILSLASSLAEK